MKQTGIEQASSPRTRAREAENNKTLTTLLGQMISLTTYLAQAAYHNSLQNDTIICILEKLRAQIEECCPPKPMPPVCIYEPCPAPRRLTEPRIPDRPHVG